MRGRRRRSRIPSTSFFAIHIPVIWNGPNSYFSSSVRRRSLKFPARCELEGTAAKLHKLPEPGRSALALLYLGALPASDIQCVLNLDERLLADAVDKTRSALREQRAIMS